MADTTVGTGEGGTTGGQPAEAVDTDGLSPTAVATELLTATQTGTDPTPFLDALAAFDDEALAPVREDRTTGLAFWTNLYNAGTQLLLDCRPALYESSLRFVRFFRARAVTVGGADLSLNDIEDGILRALRSKYTMGYTPSLFQRSFEKRYTITPLDPRIHFALNCGAMSCPAIRAYDPDAVDEQLDLATRTYLDRTVEYDAERDTVRVPRLFLWYRGDFDGGSGTRDFLRRYGAIPEGTSPSLRYLSWDWDRAAGNFTD